MSSRLRRRALSTAFIVGFFVLWEFACLAFGISDLVLPRPSQIVATLIANAPAIWPHAVQTLLTTLAGFGIGIVAGVLLGVMIGFSRLA